MCFHVFSRLWYEIGVQVVCFHINIRQIHPLHFDVRWAFVSGWRYYGYGSGTFKTRAPVGKTKGLRKRQKNLLFLVRCVLTYFFLGFLSKSRAKVFRLGEELSPDAFQVLEESCTLHSADHLSHQGENDRLLRKQLQLFAKSHLGIFGKCPPKKWKAESQ